jgi:hypothetical protein
VCLAWRPVPLEGTGHVETIEVFMKMMAVAIALMGLLMSGSAKAAQVCGMVVEVVSNANATAIMIKDRGEVKISGVLDNSSSGTASSAQQIGNIQMVSLATTAMNNPGSLDFCMNVEGNKKIQSVSIVNRFKR